jgi:hypothetical protein
MSLSLYLPPAAFTAIHRPPAVGGRRPAAWPPSRLALPATLAVALASMATAALTLMFTL